MVHGSTKAFNPLARVKAVLEALRMVDANISIQPLLTTEPGELNKTEPGELNKSILTAKPGEGNHDHQAR